MSLFSDTHLLISDLRLIGRKNIWILSFYGGITWLFTEAANWCGSLFFFQGRPGAVGTQLATLLSEFLDIIESVGAWRGEPTVPCDVGVARLPDEALPQDSDILPAHNLVTNLWSCKLLLPSILVTNPSDQRHRVARLISNFCFLASWLPTPPTSDIELLDWSGHDNLHAWNSQRSIATCKFRTGQVAKNLQISTR